MKAVLTADIISSQKIEAKKWLNYLRNVLSGLGREIYEWEIYRGDSFQLITLPEKALLYAYLIKSNIKKLDVLDVRIAIGIGEISYRDNKVTQSNGSAFVNSGRCFDLLKKDRLAIQSSDKGFDEMMNIILLLVNRFADQWTPKVAEVISVALLHPNENQNQWAKIIGKSQSTINATLKRGGYSELLQVLKFYEKNVTKI